MKETNCMKNLKKSMQEESEERYAKYEEKAAEGLYQIEEEEWQGDDPGLAGILRATLYVIFDKGARKSTMLLEAENDLTAARTTRAANIRFPEDLDLLRVGYRLVDGSIVSCKPVKIDWYDAEDVSMRKVVSKNGTEG